MYIGKNEILILSATSFVLLSASASACCLSCEWNDRWMDGMSTNRLTDDHGPHATRCQWLHIHGRTLHINNDARNKPLCRMPMILHSNWLRNPTRKDWLTRPSTIYTACGPFRSTTTRGADSQIDDAAAASDSPKPWLWVNGQHAVARKAIGPRSRCQGDEIYTGPPLLRGWSNAAEDYACSIWGTFSIRC